MPPLTNLSCKISVSTMEDSSHHKCSGTQNWPGGACEVPPWYRRFPTLAAVFEVREAATRPQMHHAIYDCDEWAKEA